MKTVWIDGGAVRDMADVHARFAAALSFPAWYGNTLDALHDLLSEPAAEDVTVILENEDALREALGWRYRALRRVLADAAAENARLTVRMQEE